MSRACKDLRHPSFACAIERTIRSNRREKGEKKKRKKKKIDSVSMFQCSIARFFSTRDSRDSIHGSYVTRRTTRNAKLAIRNDEKRSGTGRNNLFVIVVYCENRRKFRESFRGKKSARISPPSPRQEMEKNQYLRRYDLCLQLFSSRFKKDGTVDENRTS